MRDRVARWTRDETVGWALVAAGVVVLLVQALPPQAIAWLRRAWPLLLVGAGAWLLWRKPG